MDQNGGAPAWRHSPVTACTNIAYTCFVACVPVLGFLTLYSMAVEFSRTPDGHIDPDHPWRVTVRGACVAVATYAAFAVVYFMLVALCIRLRAAWDAALARERGARPEGAANPGRRYVPLETDERPIL